MLQGDEGVSAKERRSLMDYRRMCYPCPFVPSSCSWRPRAGLQLRHVGLFILGMMLFAVLALPTAYAAAGDGGGQAADNTPCRSGLGVTSAFDGTHLWYACNARVTDLYRTDPEGTVTASYTIVGGLGALLYDAKRNGLWAGWANGAMGVTAVRFIFLDTNKNVVGSAEVHTVPDAAVCGRATGLAYNAVTDTLYISDECSGTFHVHPDELLSLGSVNTMVKPDRRVSTHESGKHESNQSAHTHSRY